MMLWFVVMKVTALILVMTTGMLMFLDIATHRIKDWIITSMAVVTFLLLVAIAIMDAVVSYIGLQNIIN